MQISPTEKFLISDQVLSQEVRGETVLLDLASENYFGLDSVGTRVWELLGEEKSSSGIVSTLFEEYEVDKKELESDVHELLERLLEAGLLSVVPEEI